MQLRTAIMEAVGLIPLVHLKSFQAKKAAPRHFKITVLPLGPEMGGGGNSDKAI